jgi:hypothetical protein
MLRSFLEFLSFAHGEEGYCSVGTPPSFKRGRQDADAPLDAERFRCNQNHYQPIVTLIQHQFPAAPRQCALSLEDE